MMSSQRRLFECLWFNLFVCKTNVWSDNYFHVSRSSIVRFKISLENLKSCNILELITKRFLQLGTITSTVLMDMEKITVSVRGEIEFWNKDVHEDHYSSMMSSQRRLFEYLWFKHFFVKQLFV